MYVSVFYSMLEFCFRYSWNSIPMDFENMVCKASYLSIYVNQILNRRKDEQILWVTKEQYALLDEQLNINSTQSDSPWTNKDKYSLEMDRATLWCKCTSRKIGSIWIISTSILCRFELFEKQSLFWDKSSQLWDHTFQIEMSFQPWKALWKRVFFLCC